MFKIFSFLKYAALIAVFGILAVFSSFSFDENFVDKQGLETNIVWQKIHSFIGFAASSAKDLGRANLESKIPLSSNVDVEEISKSFAETLDKTNYSAEGDVSESNSAWADFFAKIKEEWAKTKLE